MLIIARRHHNKQIASVECILHRCFLQLSVLTENQRCVRCALGHSTIANATPGPRCSCGTWRERHEAAVGLHAQVGVRAGHAAGQQPPGLRGRAPRVRAPQHQRRRAPRPRRRALDVQHLRNEHPAARNISSPDTCIFSYLKIVARPGFTRNGQWVKGQCSFPMVKDFLKSAP